jgi:metallo-beta-lactamase class B
MLNNNPATRPVGLSRAAAIVAGVIILAATSIVGVAQGASSQRELWIQEQAPFRIFGNAYYVGTRGLSSVLVVSDQGHVLIDGTLPENAPRIAASVRALGYRVEDIKLIVNSHAHSDHAGGIAELQRMSGAVVASSSRGAAQLKRGKGAPDDPQFEYGDSFPPVQQVQVVRDGETLRAGSVEMTVHYTPGHTPGGMSWTWTSCEKDRCFAMVYADSLNAVSDDSFKFTGDSRYPTALADLAGSIKTVASLPCDIVISAHPELAELWSRLERRSAGEPDALIDKTACRRYADGARERLDARISSEKSSPTEE